MKKKQILELIDKCPYWGEDAESEVMIKDLKKWFEFKLGEINEFEDDVVYITKKEFRFEINRLWNEIRQISCKLIGNNKEVPKLYPPSTTVAGGFSTFT